MTLKLKMLSSTSLSSQLSATNYLCPGSFWLPWEGRQLQPVAVCAGHITFPKLQHPSELFPNQGRVYRAESEAPSPLHSLHHSHVSGCDDKTLTELVISLCWAGYEHQHPLALKGGFNHC